jgi:hypothetical protein
VLTLFICILYLKISFCFCLKNYSKYSCPRCNTPYCSTSCFAVHGTDCTEKFFKQQVEAELHLQAKEGVEKESRIKTILAMTRNVTNEIPSISKDSINDNNNDDKEEEFNETDDYDSENEKASNEQREKLQHVADYIRQSESIGSFSISTVETLLGGPENMPFIRKAALEQQSRSCFRDTWFPWWKQTNIQHSLAVSLALGELSQVEENLSASLDKDDTTLQTPPCRLLSKNELLLSLPTLFDLVKSHKQPSSILLYNLLELLVAYVHTSRLYNGDHLSCIPDSAGVLLAISSVLREDARHINSVAALSSAIEATHAPEIQRSERPNFRTALETLEDVLLILKDPHFVVDALSDALNLVDGAYTEIKGLTYIENIEELRVLEAASRKLFFFIVWANDTLVRSDTFDPTGRFNSEFDRISAGVESGKVLCERLRDDTFKFLEEQVTIVHEKSSVQFM